MKIEKIEIVKEGYYYTLYINGEILGCGYLKGIINDLGVYIKMLDKSRRYSNGQK